ncbi:hypothetical protein E2562_038130 [Oryza meyeriana var. granulata]|uniref:Uncharacterized protein n=1 Tax=Oryza meyeriana var. granulata TaxID=110450 RepID=A0A6G1CXL6_9ORYZ|nr:hypothetical protein E2562_038130 [Oryza meyeriana var. granulata]KAF0904851.1 hypothetical protein E2562_038130 [Oryza meyeriana var. granulata]KAF0904854.1 hypothetical protein E2562_038130 [Oryza meyeriana var. granulata]KAF0904855.1 hypothetical protein E2562_038130 [Oryza meyeriana var. granulata]KAF0904858.1 hypothetical protein E2562_038130 [Oryza meyeriana var. granulata]
MRSRGLHDGCRTYGGAAWLKHCRGGDLWGDNDLGDSSTGAYANSQTWKTLGELNSNGLIYSDQGLAFFLSVETTFYSF